MKIGNRMLHLGGRAALAWKLKARPVVVSAGMPRSGSTLLFNMLREIMETRWGPALRSCWQARFSLVEPGEAYLVKMHVMPRFYRWRATHSFYSYRDIRTVAVSRIKKKGQALDISFFRKHIAQYELAKRHCDFCFSYEELTESRSATVERLADHLGIPVQTEQVLSRLDALSLPPEGVRFCDRTLLHPNHITNTGPEEWRVVLAPALQKEIREEFGWWFEECGYAID